MLFLEPVSKPTWALKLSKQERLKTCFEMGPDVLLTVQRLVQANRPADLVGKNSPKGKTTVAVLNTAEYRHFLDSVKCLAQSDFCASRPVCYEPPGAMGKSGVEEHSRVATDR